MEKLRIYFLTGEMPEAVLVWLKSARARDYEDAVQWLVNADLLAKVVRSAKLGLPLTAYDESRVFKLYVLDVGPLRRFSALAPLTGKGASSGPLGQSAR